MSQLKEIIAATIIKENKILMVDNRGNWAFPGGTLEEGESETQCLEREFREEFSGSRLYVRNFYRAFKGVSPRQKDTISVRMYFAEIDDGFKMPDGHDEDIKRAKWIRDISSYNAPDITKKIFESLKKDKFL